MKGCIWDFMGQQYPADIEYRLVKDSKTGSLTEERITEFMPLEKPWALALLEGITMYAEPDIKGEALTVKPQQVSVTAASDSWVQVLLEDGTTTAWIYVERVQENGSVKHLISDGKDAREIFSGFSDAG